ncbi:MAG: 2,3-diphosphoglycerate synthetase, partial [Coriobacteriia bacterium]|nr:2,3-diphosphoglycerate synthetase [Coriobacteriia bacterium]
MKPRVVALIDGEHYPPVVRFALTGLAGDYAVAAAAVIGGTEKVDLEQGMDTYGVPVVTALTPEDALRDAVARYAPDAVIDLSDEPVVSSADRFRLAGVALALGLEYRGADFVFTPPRARLTTATPALGLIGTGKRVGKTAISGYVARELTAAGRDICVLAMGRGGPAEPELIHGEKVKLTTPDLLELARQGKHASSDNYEDAVMSRVTTVGCRRCGGGMAGETFFSNVPEGARLADTLGKELIVLEGSGAAIPPVHADANILVVGAGRGLSYVRDYFGPYRLGLADLVVIATAEEPVASPGDIAAIERAVAELAPGVPCIATTFRPAPVEPVEGAKVFFATTAPAAVLPKLVEHLEREFGCEVVGSARTFRTGRSCART